MKLFQIAAGAILTFSVSTACWARDVPSRPIQDNGYAQLFCPKVCEVHGGWNGNWKCNQYGVRCVCGCKK